MTFTKLSKSILEAFLIPNRIVVHNPSKDEVVVPPEDFFVKWRTSNTKGRLNMLKLMDKGFGVSANYVDPEKNEQVLLAYKP